MKNYLKIGLTALVSGGVCSTLTYILTKRYYEEKTQEEIKETRDIYRKKLLEIEKNDGKLPDLVVKPAEKEKKENEEEEKTTAEVRQEYSDYTKKYKYQDGKPDLDEFAKHFRPAHIENAVDPEKAAEEMAAEAGLERIPERNWRDLCERPYTIEYDLFNQDQNYEKRELWLYADGVLAEEDPVQGYCQVTDVDQIVGYENLECLDGEDPDEETYVRNERLGTDFIIYRISDETFQEALLGVDNGPVVEKIKKKRRLTDED